MNDPARITTNVGLINGGTARNTVAEDCMIEVDLRFSDRRTQAGELEQKGAGAQINAAGYRDSVTGKITQPLLGADRRSGLRPRCRHRAESRVELRAARRRRIGRL
jgi:acetylornithine deacetylase/succinyl-diaminopimelate desuccinylase-like protein